MKVKRRKRIHFMIGVIVSVILVIMVSIVAFVNQPKFGRLPSGERLERIKRSPNFREGQFRNLHTTPQITSNRGYAGAMVDFLFGKKERVRPETSLPVLKTDLHKLNREEDILVWFGHSSYFIQTDGKRFLVDPVFDEASPVSFFNKPFKGPDVYRAEDIPEIDYLIISHDHWDHLDYTTVMQLKERTGKVICGLGVGEHFEYWGFDKDRLIELDWNEKASLLEGFTIDCLPARHFSGRGLSPNRTLWASFLLQTPTQRIYIAGDGGYDTHFKEIGNRFSPIDLAIIENGQYNQDWRYIHLMPELLSKAVADLHAQKLLTVHNSKYALAKHPWDEPLNNISDVADKDTINLITPMMGELVYLKDTMQVFREWWK